MSELIKIRDMANRYDLSARTLRYYEDMGLIKSVRREDYAYRLYDEANVKRLEQRLSWRCWEKRLTALTRKSPFCMN